VTVFVDAGEPPSTPGLDSQACARRWPFAVVTDANGAAVASQWTAVIGDTKAGELAHAYLAAKAGTEAPLSPETLSGTLRSVTLGGNVAQSMRYELSFAVDIAGLSLATYFVTTSWSVMATSEQRGVSAASASGASLSEIGVLLSAPGCGEQASAPASAHPHLPLGAAAATTMVSVPRPPDLPPAKVLPLNPGLLDRITALTAPPNHAPIVLENACLALEVDRRTGLLLGVTYKHAATVTGAAPVRVAVRQRFGAYSTSSSGAYIFRPQESPVWWDQVAPSSTVQISSVPLVDAENKDLILGGLVQQVKVAGSIFTQVRSYV
jgi:hypothetical protein